MFTSGSDWVVLGWVVAKSLYFYGRKGKEMGRSVWMFWMVASWVMIRLGLYVFGVANTGLGIIAGNGVGLIVVLASDAISSWWVGRKDLPEDGAGVLGRELVRSLAFFFLLMVPAFAYEAVFWLMVVVSNIFHLRLGGYQY